MEQLEVYTGIDKDDKVVKGELVGKYISGVITNLDILDIINPQTNINNTKLKDYDAPWFSLIYNSTFNKIMIESENSGSALVSLNNISGDLELVGPVVSAYRGSITDEYIYYFPKDDIYKFTNDENATLDISIAFANSLISATSSNANEIIFYPNGKVSITGDKSDYDLSLTFNEGYYTLPWYTIKATGKNMNSVSFEQAPNGVMLISDNFTNVKIIGENDIENVELIFSTDKGSVLIKNDGNTLSVYTDSNSDGIYDTKIAQSAESPNNTNNGNNNSSDNSNSDVTISQANKGKSDENNNNETIFPYSHGLISGLTEEQNKILETALKNIGLTSAGLSTHITVSTEIDESKTPLYVKIEIEYDGEFDPTKISYYRLNDDDTFTAVPTEYNSETNKITIYANKSGIYVPIINENSFTDIKETDWFYQYVNKAVTMGIVNGRSKEIFDPLTSASYADTVAMLFRAMGISPNAQVENDSWSNSYIDKAVSLGIYDNEWNAIDVITRERMSMIVANSLKMLDVVEKLTESEVNELFNDLIDSDEISKEAKEAMAICIKSGLIIGVNTEIPTIDPQGNFTRAQMATIAVRLRKLFIEKIETRDSKERGSL
jgi:hypothetical protein